MTCETTNVLHGGGTVLKVLRRCLHDERTAPVYSGGSLVARICLDCDAQLEVAPPPAYPEISESDIDDLAAALTDAFHELGRPIALGLRDQVAERLLRGDWYAHLMNTTQANP